MYRIFVGYCLPDLVSSLKALFGTICSFMICALPKPRARRFRHSFESVKPGDAVHEDLDDMLGDATEDGDSLVFAKIGLIETAPPARPQGAKAPRDPMPKVIKHLTARDEIRRVPKTTKMEPRGGPQAGLSYQSRAQMERSQQYS